MQDKVFIDSNVFIYAFLEGSIYEDKRDKTIALIENLTEKAIIVSTQVLGEIYNTLNKKYKIDKKVIIEKLDILTATAIVESITLDTVKKSCELSLRNNYTYYDNLIISAALENNCSIIYTEDMHSGQIIDNTLKIINPFE